MSPMVRSDLDIQCKYQEFVECVDVTTNIRGSQLRKKFPSLLIDHPLVHNSMEVFFYHLYTFFPFSTQGQTIVQSFRNASCILSIK